MLITKSDYLLTRDSRMSMIISSKKNIFVYLKKNIFKCPKLWGLHQYGYKNSAIKETRENCRGVFVVSLQVLSVRVMYYLFKSI